MTPEDASAVVRRFEEEYAAAFNRKDAGALAALFAEDATIVTEWGDLVMGRAEFERGLARAFANMPGELSLENVPRHTSQITDGVIVSHGLSRRMGPSGEDQLVYTRVLVRQVGGWRLAANHVAEPSRQSDPRAAGR